MLESEVYRQLNNGPPLDYSPPITQVEIRENLKHLKNTSTPGSDGLSTIWLKLSIEQIMPLIELIFNACVSFNYFPPSWRSAKVIVLKKPNKDCYETVSSFRPISILNSLSKLFERILHTRLKKLAVDNQWFSHNQHGFREGKSTETAVTDLVNHIECSWKAKKTVACRNHSCTTLKVGFLQGSILSPFLWNILLESLFLLYFSFYLKIIAYADDILLCATSVLAHLAVNNLQLMCNSVVDWGLNSKLSFNALKTVFMVFSRKQFDRSALCLVINSVSIPHSRECRYLGLIIDEKLNWRAHIAKICTEATKTFNTIKRCFRLSWGLSSSKLLLLYNAVIIPKISYCCPSWVSATKFSWCRTKLRSFQCQIATSIC